METPENSITDNPANLPAEATEDDPPEAQELKQKLQDQQQRIETESFPTATNGIEGEGGGDIGNPSITTEAGEADKTETNQTAEHEEAVEIASTQSKEEEVDSEVTEDYRAAVVNEEPVAGTSITAELSDTKKDAVKEPEEPEHAEKCSYEQTPEEASKQTQEQMPEQTTEKDKQEVKQTVTDTERTNGIAENAKPPEVETAELSSVADTTSETESETKAAPKDEEASKDEKTEEEETGGWTYVLGHDLLKKKTVEPGSGVDSRPVHGQLVTVKLEGKLEDGTVVEQQDSTKFTLGDGDVTQALDLCLALMELNEVALIETDAKYAYGTEGRKPDIPANAKLTYEVKLLEVAEAPKYSSMAIDERIKHGDGKRERGNYYYSRGEWGSAINSYSKALQIVDDSKESHSEEASELQKLLDVRLKCHNNLAAAQLKVEAWDAAIKSCDHVLGVQPGNIKALFRKGKCLSSKGETEDAIVFLRKALKEDPSSKIIHEELSRLVARHKKQEESQRNMYQRMLGTDKQSQKAKNKKSGKMWYVGGAVAAAVASLGIAAYRYWHM